MAVLVVHPLPLSPSLAGVVWSGVSALPPILYTSIIPAVNRTSHRIRIWILELETKKSIENRWQAMLDGLLFRAPVAQMEERLSAKREDASLNLAGGTFLLYQ